MTFKLFVLTCRSNKVRKAVTVLSDLPFMLRVGKGLILIGVFLISFFINESNLRVLYFTPFISDLSIQ